LLQRISCRVGRCRRLRSRRVRPQPQADPAAGQFLHDGSFIRVGYLVRQHEAFRRAPVIEFRRSHRRRPLRPAQPRSNLSAAAATRKRRGYNFRSQSDPRPRSSRKPAARAPERPLIRASHARHIRLRVQGRASSHRGQVESRGARRRERHGARLVSRCDSPLGVCILLLTGEVLSTVQSTKSARQP
jgi:hypothetical protein